MATFFRCLWRTLFPDAESPVRYTKARILAMFVWLPLCLVLGVVHWCFLLLDEILFPAYRRVDVKAPLFIVGPPRGGTTFLHRVLSKDTERFTCYTFGEMVFTPSITQRYIVAFFNRIDRALGRPLRRLLERLERPHFEPYAHMHKVSLFEPEEDFVMLGYLFANPLQLVIFPCMDQLAHLWFSDRDTPPAQQDRMFRFYRRCLQRHLYFHGTDKTHLSKNPYFTSMMEGILRTFPDAKFVLNVRDPQENVPSFLSIWDALYFDIGNAPDHYMAQEFILEWLEATYLHGGEVIDTLNDEQGTVVPYAPLKSRPKATVLELYDALGYTASDAYLATLVEQAAQAQAYRSVHQYGAETYGLSEEKIAQRFAKVYARYPFLNEDRG